MKFEETVIWGFEHAMRGARNPMNSWDRSDSGYGTSDTYESEFVFGPNDLKLAQQLIKAGNEHRKFLRQIFVSVDITAPLYWWKEFDTYKIGTVASSTSSMHKLSTTPITIDCFETDDFDSKWFDETGIESICDTWIVDNIIFFLEELRETYLRTKDKRYWKELIRFLPESWLQKRTVTMNYENLYSMIRQRKDHKLNEWSGKDNAELPNFISWAKTLPYADELLFLGLED